MNPETSNGFIPLFIEKAATEKGRAFATISGEATSFEMIDKMSASFANSLRERGYGRGIRIAVMMNNSAQLLGVLFAIARAGAIWVPINTRLLGNGLKYVLEHCQPEVVVVDANLRSAITASDANINEAWVITTGDGPGCLNELLQTKTAPFEEASPTTDATFAIMYTSGTTGPPKGAIVTHGMMRLAGEAVAELTGATDGDTFFVWEPLFHIGGAQLLVIPLIRAVRLAIVSRFSASAFWNQVRAERATHIHYLGGILQILLKQPTLPTERDHSVRIAWGGGCPPDIWNEFEQRFNVEIRECYGMTEASSITTYNKERVVGSVGRPLPWFEVEVRDESGQVLAPGEKGEISVRQLREGAIFPGYFRNELATAKSLRDGWLYTGDLGSFDTEGHLRFHGRMTDNVRCRGENVSAWEVEHVAMGHPAVEECAMIGVPAEIGEQDIKLFVKKKPDATITEESLSAWLAERLASFQMPRFIALVKEFEKTPSERIRKHLLSKDRNDCWDRSLST